MKIWQLDPAQLTPFYNIAVCDALAQAGHEVDYLCSHFIHTDDLHYPSSFRTKFVYFRWLSRPQLRSRARLRRVLRGVTYPLDHVRLLSALRQAPPDVLHIQWSRLPFVDRWFVKTARAQGVPVIHTVHNVVSSFSSPRDVELLGKLYADCDALVLHSAINQRDFQALYPHIDADKLHIVPHIRLEKKASHPAPTRAEARHQLGIPQDAPVMLFFGVVREYKGLNLLVDAFQQAQAQRPDLWLMVAGAAQLPEDQAAVQRARALPNTVVHEGFVPEEKLGLYHAAADVAVFPYRAITQSGAVITTMDHALPVIVTDVGALPDLVDQNGWVIPPDNVPALIDALLDAASDRERLHRYGARSREIVVHDHGAETVAARLTEIYQHVIKQRSAS